MSETGKYRSHRYRRRGISCLGYFILVLAVSFGVNWIFRKDKPNESPKQVQVVDSLHVVEKAPVEPKAEIKAQSVEMTKPVDNPKEERKPRMITKGDYLLVEKSTHQMRHYRDGKLIATYAVGLGKNPEDKLKEGDMATPEGHYEVNFIKDSSTWAHDFKDGKGEIKGAYGPYFIALYTGAKGSFSGKLWRGIGIHGTHDPSSIGKNASEGCIRLINDDVRKLKADIEGKTRVQIDIVKSI